MTERARLSAVAVHLERPPQPPLDEAGDDHPVPAASARPDGVEEARDHTVEAALLVEAEGKNSSIAFESAYSQRAR